MEQFVSEIEKTLLRAGEILKNADRDKLEVDAKDGIGNFVTDYDKKIQDFLKTELLRILPEAVFVGEEEDVHSSIEHGLSFIVDPIDGTYNFMRDLHLSVISVAVAKDGEPYIGLIYAPFSGEMFTAQKGEGAWLNGKRIHVSRNLPEGGLVLFGTSPYHKELRSRTLAHVDKLMDTACDVRRMGSAALDLACIASGKAEMYFELVLQPWDYGAGVLLVTEAGGKVTTFDGQPISYGKASSILAANGCDWTPYL